MTTEFKNTEAYSFINIAWSEMSDEDRVCLVAELMSRLSENHFEAAKNIASYEWLDRLNEQYLSLLYKHDGDTEFEHPENWDAEGTAPEHIMYCNAFDDLMSYCTEGMRNEVEWSAVDDDHKHCNSYGVAIVLIV